MKLKPCPFCKVPATEYDGDAVFNHKPSCWLFQQGYTDRGEQWISSKREIEQWNTRPPDPLLSEALEALREIAKGEGAYDQDQLQHAGNCIENMKSIAKAIITKAEEEG